MADDPRDVMQVCRNGHVVTDLLYSLPERRRTHCQHCGAVTLDSCLTCGAALPGAIPLPGMFPMGNRPAPEHCEACGAAFPWSAASPLAAANDPLALLESLLRRVPHTIRELRTRQADRPAYCITDQRDLEDVVRSVLPLCFDDIRPLCRTPHYAVGTRTDFLLARERLVLVVKLIQQSGLERELAEQWQEDIGLYLHEPACAALVGFAFDPQGLLIEPQRLETMLSRSDEDLAVRWTCARG